MNPKQTAALITTHHDGIRTQLDDLAALMEPAPVGPQAEAFYAACERLCQTLLTHIDTEDAVMVPLLRTHHPTGDSEAEEVLRHHKAQRAWLTEVLAKRETTPSHDALMSVRALIHILRVDMEHEEAELRRVAQ